VFKTIARFMISRLGRRIIGAVLANGLGIGVLGLTCPPAAVIAGATAMLLPTALFLFRAARSRF